MGAQVDLFCKFTRKTDIGPEEVCVGWFRTDEMGGWGTLLRSGPRRGRGWSFEGLVYRLELDAEWVREE
jgi:hypothetical protein